MKLRGYTDVVSTYDEVRYLLAATRQDIDRLDAIAIADRFRAGQFKSAVRVLERADVSARLLRLIADEWEGKRPKGELTPTGFYIVLAWIAVRECYRKRGDDRKCTAREVKVEYAHSRLGLKRPANQGERRWIAEPEREKKIPSDQTFRKTLARCTCELRKGSN